MWCLNYYIYCTIMHQKSRTQINFVSFFNLKMIITFIEVRGIMRYMQRICHQVIQAHFLTLVVVIVQSPSHVQLLVTPLTAACQASLSLTISWSLPKFMSIASVMPSSHLILWLPLLLLPSIFPSIRDFSNESVVGIRWPKYWSISFSISPSNKYSGLISLKVWSPCSPRDFQQSSPSPQFKGINSSAFYLLYSPAVITGHDHWEDHSLDYIDLCQQSNVSTLQHTV